MSFNSRSAHNESFPFCGIDDINVLSHKYEKISVLEGTPDLEVMLLMIMELNTGEQLSGIVVGRMARDF